MGTQGVMQGPMSKVTGAGSMATGKPTAPASPMPKNVGDYFKKFTRPSGMIAAGSVGFAKKADLDDIRDKMTVWINRMMGKPATTTDQAKAKLLEWWKYLQQKGKGASTDLQDWWNKINSPANDPIARPAVPVKQADVGRPEAYGKTLLGGALGGAGGLVAGGTAGLLANVLAAMLTRGKISLRKGISTWPATGATIGGALGTALGAGEGAYQTAKSASVTADDLMQFALYKMGGPKLPPPPQGTPNVPPVPRSMPAADPTLNSAYANTAKVMGKPRLAPKTVIGGKL